MTGTEAGNDWDRGRQWLGQRPAMTGTEAGFVWTFNAKQKAGLNPVTLSRLIGRRFFRDKITVSGDVELNVIHHNCWGIDEWMN